MQITQVHLIYGWKFSTYFLEYFSPLISFIFAAISFWKKH